MEYWLLKVRSDFIGPNEAISFSEEMWPQALAWAKKPRGEEAAQAKACGYDKYPGDSHII